MCHHRCGWGDILPINGNPRNLGRSFSSLFSSFLQPCLSSLWTEGWLLSFDQYSFHLYMKVIQRNPVRKGTATWKIRWKIFRFHMRSENKCWRGWKWNHGMQSWCRLMWPMTGDVAYGSWWPLCSSVKHLHSVLANIQEDKAMVENWGEQGLGLSDFSLKSLWWHFHYLCFSECIVHLCKYSVPC